MINIKKEASKFIKAFKITEISSESLISAIERCGFKIIRYRPFSNNEHVHKLLESLNLLAFASVEKAFTYKDKYNRLVFLCEGVSEEEACILLAHEAGHVYLNHLSDKYFIVGTDVIYEHQANEFCHYLLTISLLRSIYFNFMKYRPVYIFSIIIAFALILSSLIMVNIFSSEDNMHYYISENGEKYHRKKCISLKGVNDVTRITADELQKNGYKPCQLCIPD